MDIIVQRGIHISSFIQSSSFEMAKFPEVICLNFLAFRPSGFFSLVKEGDKVIAGEPLARHLLFSDLMFVSPVSGIVQKIVYFRGKRPSFIEIALLKEQSTFSFHKIASGGSPIEIIKKLANGGLLNNIRVLPFDTMPDPKVLPRAIFINVCEDPFNQNISIPLKKHNDAFLEGIRILLDIVPFEIHIVYNQEYVKSMPLPSIDQIHIHKVSGLYPSSHASVHVHSASPIIDNDDCVWTLSFRDVIAIGYQCGMEKIFPYIFCSVLFCDNFIRSIGTVETVLGSSIDHILKSIKFSNFEDCFFISGDLFLGKKIDSNGFLRTEDSSICILPKDFIGGIKDSVFWSSIKISPSYDISSFDLPLDPSVYEQYFPMNILLASLIRSCIAGNFTEAFSLGLIELSQRDAAIFSSVCPAHFDFISTITEGLDYGFTEKYPNYRQLQ